MTCGSKHVGKDTLEENAGFAIGSSKKISPSLKKLKIYDNKEWVE